MFYQVFNHKGKIIGEVIENFLLELRIDKV